MDWVWEYAHEFEQDLGAKIVQVTEGKHSGVTVEMDTAKLLDLLSRRGDWIINPFGIGGSLFEDYLITTLDAFNRDVRLFIKGIGKTNIIARVDIDRYRAEWKMRRRSRVKITPRRRQ